MIASLSTVRKGSLDKTHVSYEANSMFDDLMGKAKFLACFLDTSTTNELAGMSSAELAKSSIQLNIHQRSQ